MFILCKVSARLCKVFYCMAPLKNFSSFIGMILLLLLIGGVIGGRTGSIGNLELEKRNTAIKIVQSEDGDIINCVDIQTQPALSHPRLKNHSIQMRPSFYRRGMKSDLSSKTRLVKQIWRRSGSCPVGTIPILRNLEEGPSKTFPFPRYRGEVANNGQEEDTLAYCSQGAPYYGTSAILNIWSVYVEPNEYSVNFVEILNKDVSNFAGVGWGVYPNLFGDNRTRLFNYWADSKTNRGCFDLSCAGFVQVNNKVVLGGTIWPLSTYNGDQYEFDINIIKDDNHSCWWLFILGQLVGYWPVSIFSDLNEASHLVWGGGVYNGQKNGQHTSTQLGSGHFAQEGLGKAAYMHGVQAMNSARVFVTPHGIGSSAAKPGCYNITWATDLGTPGASFYYGGPGGSGCA